MLATNTEGQAKAPGRTVVKEVTIPANGLTVRDLASRLSMKVQDIRYVNIDVTGSWLL